MRQTGCDIGLRLWQCVGLGFPIEIGHCLGLENPDYEEVK